MMDSKDNQEENPVLRDGTGDDMCISELQLPRLLTNRTKNGYVVLIYKNAWDPKLQMSKRVLGRSIGKIMSDDGLGEVIFNERFLSENPSYRDYIITKTGRGKYSVVRRDEAEAAGASAQSDEISGSETGDGSGGDSPLTVGRG